jgi:hypothetical protein
MWFSESRNPTASGCCVATRSPLSKLERVEASDVYLALPAGQFGDDALTGDQLQRITASLRPKPRGRASELADYAGPGITNAWARSATYTGKQVTRPVGDADHHSCVGQGERSDV